MNPVDELQSALSGPSRAIVIARKDLDLREVGDDNLLFVLKIGEGSLASGGRGGGFGERKVTSVYCFELREGVWSKLFGTETEEKSSEFEVPYYVSRIPMTMPNGTETMGYGIVDPELVETMAKKAGVSSSA